MLVASWRTVTEPVQTPLTKVAVPGVMLTGLDPPWNGSVRPTLSVPIVTPARTQSLELLWSSVPVREKLLVSLVGPGAVLPVHWLAGIVVGLVMDDGVAAAP